MRFIHFADLHVGYERYGVAHMEDTLRAYDFMVAYALDRGVDAVIFAGDAFKSREPTTTQLNAFLARLPTLTEAGISVYLVPGNHDLSNTRLKPSALEVVRTTGMPLVHLGDERAIVENAFRPYYLPTRAGVLQCVTSPWPSVRTYESVGKGAAEAAEARVEFFQRQGEHVDRSLPSILVGHMSVNTPLVVAGAEQLLSMSDDPIVLLAQLDGPWDYLALGHFHNPGSLKLGIPGGYAGSMTRVDFGEEGQPKGFNVVEIDEGHKVKVEWVDVPVREFITFEAAPKEEDPTPELLSVLASRATKDAVVRMRWHLSEEQARRYDGPRVLRALDGAYMGGVQIVTPEKRREGAERITASPEEPMKLLRQYLELQGVEGEALERRLSAAATLIEEGD